MRYLQRLCVTCLCMPEKFLVIKACATEPATVTAAKSSRNSDLDCSGLSNTICFTSYPIAATVGVGNSDIRRTDYEIHVPVNVVALSMVD